MIQGLLRGEKSWVLADQAVVSGCSAITQVLLAARLGLTSYGYFSVVVIAQIFLLSVQQAGITGIYQVLAPGKDAGERNTYDKQVAGGQAAFLILLTAIGAGFCFCSVPAFSPLDRIAAVLNILFFLLQDFYRKIFLTQGKGARTFIIDALNNGLQLAGLLLMVVLAKTSFSLALWICALSYLPALVLGQVWYGVAALSISRLTSFYHQHKAQGGWMILSALLQWFAGNFYMVAAGWWLGAAMLGALRLGQYLFGLLHVLMQAVESYALPKAARIADDPALAITYLKAMLRKMLMVMLPILLLIVSVGKPVLRLVGKGEMDAAFAILSGLSLTYLFVAGAYPIRIALRIFRLNRAYFTGYAIAASFSLATAWGLIHTWGVWGVMAGLVFSQIILLTFWITTLHKHYTRTWKSSTSS